LYNTLVSETISVETSRDRNEEGQNPVKVHANVAIFPDESIDARDRRRERFIDATLKSLANHGYSGTTVRRIAEEAGVAPGLLTHYFSGKDALIAAAYDALGAWFSRHFDAEIAAAGDDPISRLCAFLSASFRPPNLDPDLLRVWVNFWSLVVTDPAIRAVHARTYADYRARVAGLVEGALAAKGRAASQAEIGYLSIAISALLDGLWLELCLDPSAFEAESGEKIAFRSVGSMLGIDLTSGSSRP
jgi:AcrR family transcriptional regulator